MKLIVGLGNPGEKYLANRHNVGHLVLDKLAQKVQNSKFKIQSCNLKLKANKKLESEILKVNNLIFVKPLTYMNSSGKAVRKLITHYSLSTPDLWVIHDDLDITLGDYKIQKGKGPKDHKGLLSIDKALGTRDYWHVRVGVENRINFDCEPSFAKAMEGKEYVLQDFSQEELVTLSQAIDKIVKDLINRLTN